LLDELKRRNVIRMAGLYLVGSWLLVQVAGTLLPMFEAPAWVARTIVVLLALGFVPALIFSWVYELTPQGLRRDAEVPPDRSIGHATGRRMDFAIIAVLLAALGYFAVDRFVFEPRRIAQARTEGATPAHVDTQAGRSIVVLPFADMSQAKDQEYFSDGLAEELLNLLAKVPQLRVISRSSAFSFKGKSLDVATIAKQLDVAHVLEGSVRKSGNQVRITVQLIDARTDAHLWSETYDRPLENIFAIQDEIAAAVVAQLKVTLLGAAPKTAVTDPEAYALFLKGRELYRVGSREAYIEAIDQFEHALKLSPDYAPAWRMLGSVYLNQSARGMHDVEEGTRLGREAVNRALALQPDYAPAEADLGWIANAYDRDMRAAARHTERAFALDPTNIDVLITAGLTARSLGRLELALAVHQRQVALDPANPGAYGQLGKVYAFLGRDSAAIASYRKAFALSPGDGHDRAKAEEALALGNDEPSESYRLLTQAMAYHALGRKAESDAAMAELERRFQRGSSYNIAYAYVFRDEPDRAFAALEHAAEYNDSGLSEVFTQPMFAPLRSDPRWLPYLRKIGRDPAELAAIPFQVALPNLPGATAAEPGAAR
jgi:TolB-like protein/Flp pilus assembly protein TadD